MTTCDNCNRERTPNDFNSYSPLQFVMGTPLGWYSGDDGEICGECMTQIIRSQ